QCGAAPAGQAGDILRAGAGQGISDAYRGREFGGVGGLGAARPSPGTAGICLQHVSHADQVPPAASRAAEWRPAPDAGPGPRDPELAEAADPVRDDAWPALHASSL